MDAQQESANRLGSHPEPGRNGPHLETAQASRHRQTALSIVLFVTTFVSALLSQLIPLRPWPEALTDPLGDLAALQQASMFAVPLMGILLAHEMGHFLTARRYGVDQSPPFFIPAPTLFGTLGAVILMRSQPRDRRVLLNVAVMGPYAGLLVAVPAAAWGLAHSMPINPEDFEGGMWFGSSLLFHWLEETFSPNGTDVLLHPVGFAGWVGMFVTSLNLIPAAQLDGGHVAYALFGRNQERISLAIVLVLFATGMFVSLLGEGPVIERGGAMWIIWAMLLFVIGLRHPPVRDESVSLSGWQKANALLAMVIFVATFIPVPVKSLGVRDTREKGRIPPAMERTPLGPPELPRYDGPAEEFRL